MNNGRRGLRDFRVTYAFSPGWSIDQQRHDATSSNYMASFGSQGINGATWSTVEFTAGPIYAPDDLWIATIAIKGAPNATCQVRWHIDSEDGRVPLHGWSEPVTLTFAALPSASASPTPAASAGS